MIIVLILTDCILIELGLLGPNGERWREQRQFALHTLRDLGFNRPVMENSIVDEIHEIFKIFDQFKNKKFDPKFFLNSAVANVISRLAFGKRFSNDDKEVFKLLNTINEATTEIKQSFVCEFFWWKIFLFPLQMIKIIRVAIKFRQNVRTFADPMVKQHQLEFDQKSVEEPADYIQAFLKMQKQNVGKFFTGQKNKAKNFNFRKIFFKISRNFSENSS